MTAGPLHPDNLTAGKDRSLGRGHGVGSLGPSDTSDSGSDSIGEADTDSDSDSSGTGERAAAVRDTTAADGADIDTDHVESVPPVLDEDEGEGRRSRR
jgi:hypothetical protein